MDEVNLLPGDFIGRQQRLALLRPWIAGLIVTFLILPVGWLALQRQLRAAQSEVASLQQQRARLKQGLDQLKGLREQRQELQAKQQIIATLFTRVPLRQLLFDIAALTDAQLWLTRIQLRQGPAARAAGATPPPRPNAFFTLGKAAPSSPTPTAGSEAPGMAMVLHGYTTSTQRLADFLAGLATAPHLSKTTLRVARQGKFLNYDAVEFAIDIHL